MSDNSRHTRLVVYFAIFFVILTFLTIFTVVLFTWKNSNDENVTKPPHENLFKLSIIHFNDFHARFEEIDSKSMSSCGNITNSNCVGGIARMTTVIKELKHKHGNSIVLDAGDDFQGTFWYNLLRYNVTSHFLNLLPIDASVVGNHEFAHQIKGLIPFLSSLKSPVVIANVDSHHEPDFQNLFRKSLIIERDGRKIGIIGVIYREVSSTAITGNLKFTDESEAIRNEATKLRQKGVNIIIVLSHCGIERDREIALETGDFVDIIVGGHSHSFLYSQINGTHPSPVEPVASYPIVVTPKSQKNRKVLIVQAFAFSNFVGDLTVYFNKEGHVKFYEGNPIYVSNEVEKDQEVERHLIPWRKEVENIALQYIGRTENDMLHDMDCRRRECLLGSFVNDGFVHETNLAFPQLKVFSSIIHAGGLRGSLRKGNITYGDVLTLFPFSNTLDIVELRGETLFEIFEHGISRSWSENEFIGAYMLQVSGFQLTFNITKPVGARLQTIQIRVNEQEDYYEDINPHRVYPIILPSFLAQGGDGFTMISTSKVNHRVGLLDVDLAKQFIEHKTPISTEFDNRIVIFQ